MARAFAEKQGVSFTSDGRYFITYLVTFVDPSQQLVEPAEVTIEISATDSSLAMQVKVTAAIKQAAANLGLSVTNAEITQPAYIKGITIYNIVQTVSTTNVNVNSPGDTVGGYTLAANDRVLLPNQNNLVENGIYNWVDATTPMTRASDADGGGEIVTGAAASVLNGTDAGTQWMVIATSPTPWVPGTSTSKWAKFVFPTLF
jgi:hypothetical protein